MEKGDAMNELEKARETINVIDEQIADLYVRRMDAAKQVAAYKKEHNLPVFDPVREKQLIAGETAKVKDPAYRDSYGEFLQFLMDQSKVLQKTILSKGKTAYCGVPGAFAHQVCQRLFPHTEITGCASFEEVLRLVAEHEVEQGILPLENSYSGLVGEVMDGLMNYPVYITEVVDEQIQQCLLGVPGATLKDVQTVYSKDQALAQCAPFVKALGAAPVPYPNTALAAKDVAKSKDKSKAAIGAKENAMLYGLDVLVENIESDKENTTRFLVVKAAPNAQMYPQQSVLFSVSNTPGALASVISVLAKYGLNMDCLQSRPRKNKPFEYFFYLQITSGADEETIRRCMEEIEPLCQELKWLGSYPARGKDEEA